MVTAGLLHPCFTPGGPGPKELMHVYVAGLQNTCQSLEADLHSSSLLLESEAHVHTS